ncbi:MAG: DUF4340 domain-containing protein [Oligoflexales bacterium]|nr:DUF4340 domain-containing protein [Oligoflexales bacterium]
MKKSINILASLLLVQIVLAIFLLTREEPTATFTAKEPLLAVTDSSVDKIVIESKEDEKVNSLELVKKDGLWMIPSYHNFPASENKIRDFLASMGSFKKSWPVGKTKISAKQFKVVDDSFERRLTFYNADKKQSTLYLGSSPSFKKVHARVNDDDYTHSIGFNTYEAQVNSKEWIDKNYLDQERAKVKSIEISGVTFNNESGDFVLEKLEEGQETDRSKVSPIASKAIAPSFDEVLGLKEKVQHGDEVFSYVVQVGEEAVKYKYYQSLVKEEKAPESSSTDAGNDKKPEERLILTTSNSPFAFEVGKKKIESLMGLDAKQLAKAKDVESQGENKSEESDEKKKDALNETQSERSSYADDEESERESLVFAED